MGINVKAAAIGTAVGVGVALVGIPAGISVLGFQAAGIAAGSVAAKMMSAAAIANGGGVAAGSTVAVLQSIELDTIFQMRSPQRRAEGLSLLPPSLLPTLLWVRCRTRLVSGLSAHC
ncbi:interferon alpha-inducible protein 27-like protein 2A isoform X2 [Cuculus canorus]|uniref:interferon alpha-inducible protein 27-like protein 2A isoform X2 n=1 Tax=Cuculus canorus TaxID=55661 RepID=UPI0023AA2AA4|nr:interferon alpha-inducible protein 27-like protein 2A isoform X2 [Cuculus canorus]